MKQHRQMADMMKKVVKGGMGSLAGMFGGKIGGMMPGLGNMPVAREHGPGRARSAGAQDGHRSRNRSRSRRAPEKTLTEKLPTDVGKLLNSGPGLPGLGGNRFPGLPGLGGGFVPKKK